MKKQVLGLAAALGFAGLAASAQSVPLPQPPVYGDTAKVLSATPIYDRVAYPRRECRTEPVTRYEERVRTAPEEYRPERREGLGAGAVLGAIVGGVIGHQFGNSTGGRDHGTAAGAVIGGLVGNSIEKDADDGYRRSSRDVYVDRAPVTRDVQRCDTIADARETIVGYEVRYEYNGRQFTTRMPFDPGPQMPVNVEVRPPHVRDTLMGPRPPNYRGPF